MFRLRIGPEAELRLLQERHAEELFALVDQNRERLRDWLPWVDGIRTVEDERSFIRGSLEQYASNGAFAAGIWSDGGLAGSIGLHPIDRDNRITDIGYWISADREGRGLVTMAFRAFDSTAAAEYTLLWSSFSEIPPVLVTRVRLP